MVSSWCIHGAYMNNRDKEQGLGYDFRAHVYSMLALRQTYDGLVMDIRTVHRHQSRTHSRCIVVVQTMDSLYKQSVEYCCGSLSSSLVNYTTHVPYQISAFEIYCLYCYWTLVQQLPQHKVYGVLQSLQSLEKPKNILQNMLIKYNLPLQKPKRTG